MLKKSLLWLLPIIFCCAVSFFSGLKVFPFPPLFLTLMLQLFQHAPREFPCSQVLSAGSSACTAPSFSSLIFLCVSFCILREHFQAHPPHQCLNFLPWRARFYYLQHGFGWSYCNFSLLAILSHPQLPFHLCPLSLCAVLFSSRLISLIALCLFLLDRTF